MDSDNEDRSRSPVRPTRLKATPRRIDVVRNLDDVMRWQEHCFAVILERFGLEALLRLGASLAVLTLSTACSGVGAPEIALEGLCKALMHFLLGVPFTFVSLWCIESRLECRYELRMLPNAP